MPDDVHNEFSIKNRKYSQIVLNSTIFFPSLVYSLPLPQLSNEWGVAQLILRSKLPTLVNVLILLLLERSLLIVGERSEEVSACAFALLELLQPYKWASIFLPLLPEDMIDFISSPVPFIAGMISSDKSFLKRILMDPCVKHERMNGLSIIDLADGNVLLTEKNEFKDINLVTYESMM